MVGLDGDVSFVSELAVRLFGGTEILADGHGLGGDEGGGEAARDDDAALAASLRARIAAALCALGGGDAASELSNLRPLLSKLLRQMDVAWSGIPVGWELDDDTGVYRAVADGSVMSRTKPTEPAAAVIARKNAGKGSMARAREESE